MVPTIQPAQSRLEGEISVTQATDQRYLELLQRKDDWQSLLADEVSFTSFTRPARR